MLKIRLQRVGRVHEPVFRLVLTDSKNGPKSGKSLEVLGAYDARRGEKVEFNKDRISYWLGQGAQLSGTVHNILVEKGVISGKKVNVLPKKKPILKEGAVEATPAPEASTPAPEVPAEAPAETPAETPAA